MNREGESRPVVYGDLDIEFPYTHSTGPVVGEALGAMAEGRLLGAVCPSCRIVLVPAREWCDRCGGSTDQTVPVGPGATVTERAWVHAPMGEAPPSPPFAWALIRPDGADTDLLHIVRGEAAPGDRVRPVWLAERRGAITDIECFEPGEPPSPSERAASDGAPRVPVFERRSSLRFRLSAGSLLSRFSADLRGGRGIHGVRCTACLVVLVPPAVVCPRCWADTDDWISLPDRGVVTTFVVVNVGFHGQEMPIPYVLARVLLDGADTSFAHVLGEISPENARMGLRVEAVWRSERSGFLNDDVAFFRPTGEPDAPPETYISRL